jgi:hypothetical protein
MMHKLNRWMTTVTNIGVIVGLVVLIYEVNLNTQSVQNETDVAIYVMAADNARLLIDNEQLRHPYVQIESKSWIDFSEVDRVILGTYWYIEVDRLELQFRLYKRNKQRLENIVFYESDLKARSFQEWWSSDAKALYEPEFVLYFEQLIAAANTQKKE